MLIIAVLGAILGGIATPTEAASVGAIGALLMAGHRSGGDQLGSHCLALLLITPVLILMGHDPYWLAILIAINLQTSFLTPPFGFSLFYLRGAAPKEITTGQIYAGVTPFIGLHECPVWGGERLLHK